MMKIISSGIAAILMILICIPGSASAMGVELAIGAWNNSPNGDVSFKASTAQDNLSIRNNFKYGDETRPFGRIKINTPPLFPDIYLMATPLSFSETGTKNTSFQFGNVSFSANVPFTSELKLDHYDIGLQYGIPALKTVSGGLLNIDLGLDARIIDFKARVTGQDSVSGLTVTESKSVVIAMPMLYAGFQVTPFKWLAAEGEVRGIAYGKNQYYDLIGRVKVRPFGPVFAAAGYRYEKVRIDTDDVKAKAEFRGPFGEVGVEF